MSERHLQLGHRRGWLARLGEEPARPSRAIDEAVLGALETINLAHRTLVAILFNCVPNSGHPGGSISASRIVEGLLYGGLACDLADPHRPDADLISFSAGHKALGLYVAWALRNEVARILAPDLLPGPDLQLRLEDLLGFRRNPDERSALLRRLQVKPLDGHPTPATPFVKLATGASGVGLGASFGLALSLLDLFPDDPPRVHVIEGEGGLTPGRVAEAMAAAASANLYNIVLHVDWNQSSIDSDRVCRDGAAAGDYVQWDPLELARFHDFNALLVDDGLDHRSVLGGQAWAAAQANHQPTAIVYRTVKGWRYGVEGRASHGAGHACCSAAFYEALAPFERASGDALPRLCADAAEPGALEEHQWDLLGRVRTHLEARADLLRPLAEALRRAKDRLDGLPRRPRPGAPDPAVLFDPLKTRADAQPAGLGAEPGSRTTLRQALAAALGELNRLSAGALFVSAADLAGSTSVAEATRGFDGGFYNAVTNPGSRLLACGGICEDAMGALLSALGATGRHLGVGSSYGAFIAAMQHVAARLHAIGQEARLHAFGIPRMPYIMVCAHAGLKTGEDGPTHADPQCLGLLQENFPPDSMVTLTPWDANEVWPCLVAALQARPAIVAPFVTRPEETVIDRQALGLPPATAAMEGAYALRRGRPEEQPYHGAVVLQGSGVVQAFIEEVLPRVDAAGLNMDVLVVVSVELFDRLPEERRRAVFDEARARQAMGISDFTLSTLYRWITSSAGRKASLHAFSRGRYLGSGRAEKVFEQAGLDAQAQWRAVRAWAETCQSTTGGGS